MKTCTKCCTIKPKTDFYRHHVTKDGLSNHCKSCVKKKVKEWSKANYVRHINSIRAWKKANPKYGLTLEDHSVLKKKANGCCMICRRKKSRLCIDHCHKTGRVRGLLCLHCNSGLGFFLDDIKRLQNAIEYLGKFSRISRF